MTGSITDLLIILELVGEISTLMRIRDVLGKVSDLRGSAYRRKRQVRRSPGR